MEERLQKIIAAAGIASRRAAEQLIIDGHVRVNGKVVTELGSKADASKDHIKVNGKLINPRQPHVYIMLNKPAGYVTTMSDPEGRPTVLDLLKGLKMRVYPVGRLDYNTEGLLILTNDGDFAHLVTHPKHELPKTYRAKVKGVLEDSRIAELEQGVYLDDGRTAPARVRKLSKEEVNSWVEITIHEGRKRQVRRMFDRVGHSVIKLKRVKVGTLTLGDLDEGAFRYLDADEVAALKRLSAEESDREALTAGKPVIVQDGSHRHVGKAGYGHRPKRNAGQGASTKFHNHRKEKPDSQHRRGDASGKGPRRSSQGTAPSKYTGDRRQRKTAPSSQARSERGEGRSAYTTERRPRFGASARKQRSPHKSSRT